MNDKVHLLLIDDEKNYLLVLETLLTEAGYAVTALNDPETALAFLEESEVDIVITDITMPVKSGLEMIADTREEYKYIAIILTGYSEFEYAQQAIRNGVSDYVLKPLDMDEMGAALEKAVRLAGDSQYLQKREDEAEAVRSRTALPPLSEEKVTDPLVLRIVAYLKENYQSKITLADLQEQFHYSERYINQKFQKELGTTVIDLNSSGKGSCPSRRSDGSAASASTSTSATSSKNTWAARCGSTRAP